MPENESYTFDLLTWEEYLARPPLIKEAGPLRRTRIVETLDGMVTSLAEHSPGGKGHDQRTHGRRLTALVSAAKAGGFSVSVVGDEPSKGYMVSPYPERERQIAADKLGRNDVRSFISSNKDVLSKPNHYIGGWREGDTVYLDVSVNAPTLGKAMSLGKAANQLAVYDLANGVSVDVK